MGGYAGPERRRAPRVALNVPATMRERGRPGFPVRLVDLSTHGCRLELASGVPAGAPVWLKLGGLDSIYSRVVWSRDGFAGLAFETPLHEAVVERLAGGGAPSGEEAAALEEISARCRFFAARAEGDEQSEALLALARDCDAALAGGPS